MTKERFKQPVNRQIVDEAAEWFVEINEGDADIAIRRRFHAWLSLSPEHVRAYLNILPVWEEGAQLDTSANSDPNALIAWARAATNVIPLSTHLVPSPPPGAERVRERWGRRIQLSAAASILIAITGITTWLLFSQGTYATDIGEQRVIALADGSKIELNSRSRLKVRFTDRQRSIELLAGQALFDVAKDANRPFIVQSGETYIRAIGTQFDVYRRKSGTTVTVIEGKVAVSSAPEKPRTGTAIPLNAGEQLIVAPSAVPKPERTNVAVATAWTQQRLVFFRSPLVEVAEEFNRYNQQQLVIKDDRLKAFHVSGTFSSTNPASLIRFLQAQPGIRVEETGGGVGVFSEQ